MPARAVRRYRTRRVSFHLQWATAAKTYLGCRNVGHDGQKEDNMTNNILTLAQQARTNAQLLTVSQGGIRSLTREDALKTRGDVVEAIRRLQVFEKDLAKKLDT